MIDLGVIIVSFNTKDLTLQCLSSIYHYKPKINFKIVVVDNNSLDGTVDAILLKFPSVEVLRNSENLGFSKANNQGLKTCQAKYYLFLNSDTIIKNSIDGLIKSAETYNLDILAPKLLNQDGSLQPNAGDLPYLLPLFFWLFGIDDFTRKLIPTPAFHRQDIDYYRDSELVGWVSGAAMLVGRQVIDKINGFDGNIFMYGEDVDFCFRARKNNFKIGWTDQVSIVHLGGKSSQRPKEVQWLGEFKGLLYFYKTHFGFLLMMVVKTLIILATLLRVFVFAILGKLEYAKTYATILKRL
ncbi:MAG: glycosyltransferase family 2 protein [Candidatus Daviesbacteria bacterium]|nr:glycosyltransferase family 2 protein [Candidatus Daviesbacteria bacterium]